MLASTENPTCSPVQNVGQDSHGLPRASGSQVLRYGLRTTRGRTGGVRTEACVRATKKVLRTMVQAETSRMMHGKLAIAERTDRRR